MPKVGDFDDSLVIDKNIGTFDVAMNNVSLMKVI